MVLRIETFDNIRGGNTLYKALTHPRAAPAGRALLGELTRNPPLAIYDPNGAVEAFNEVLCLDEAEITGVYVQQVSRLGDTVIGHRALPVTELVHSPARSVFVAAFDAERMIEQLEPCLPAGTRVS